MDEELYLKQYWNLPFSVRFFGVFVLSMAPLGIVLALGETISPNEGILEGSFVFFAAASLVISIMTSVLSETVLPNLMVYFVDIIIGIAAIMGLQVKYKSSASTIVLLGAFLIMYLLRIHFLYHLKNLTVAEFFQGQFKTDSVVLIAVGFLYTLGSLYHQHLVLVLLQLSEIVLFLLVIWSVVLRQLEKIERGLRVTRISQSLSWVYTILFLRVLSISALPGMDKTGVVRHKYAAPPPLEVQKKREQQQESILKQLHLHLHTFLTSNKMYRISVALFAVLIVGLGITMFLMFRKRRSNESEEHSTGSVAISERRRIRSQRLTPMLRTNRPLRLQVQLYLRNLLKQGINPGMWRSIRGVERVHRDAQIESILDEYEQERYKPPEQ